MIDGEATVKRLVRGPNYVMLRPESKNPEHKPILIEDDAIAVGVAKAILKKGSLIYNT